MNNVKLRQPSVIYYNMGLSMHYKRQLREQQGPFVPKIEQIKSAFLLSARAISNTIFSVCSILGITAPAQRPLLKH